MKKIKGIFKKNVKLVIGIIIGLIITGTTVYATILFASNQVGYNNTSSELISTDVQGALDELYTIATTWINPNDNFGTPQYYATTGKYKGWCSSTDTYCSSFAAFPTTSTTPPSGKNVYAAKYADGGYGVCIKRNGTEHCFRGRNWIAEAQHVQKVFSGISCNVGSSGVYCIASDFRCYVDSIGYVYCHDSGTNADCTVNDYGYVQCRE